MFREPIFTGRANPLRRLRASSPEGGAFNEIASFVLQPETLPPCQRLPLRGSWQNRQVLTEGVKLPLRGKTTPGRGKMSRSDKRGNLASRSDD